MNYLVVAETDTGIRKDINEDSILVKHAKTDLGEVVLAIICDGMGGLAKGELASATVIKAFSDWFDFEFPEKLKNLDLKLIGEKWSAMLAELNIKIAKYGQGLNTRLGTTFTAILIARDKYLIGHVGDTRIYHLDKHIKQLTSDHTFVAREVRNGNMTSAQAKTDKRKNMLLQCVGASDRVEPEVLMGECLEGAFLLCSDGFRHEVSEKEMLNICAPKKLIDKKDMSQKLKSLIEINKSRQETDNISAILIKIF